MYVIHENELIHVDTGSDVLEHYGVKGMKWGKRAAGYAKSFGKAYYNQYRHPILSAKASMSAASKSMTGRFMGTKRSLDYQNKFVKTQLDGNAAYKRKLKELKKNKYKKGDALNKPLDEKHYKSQEKLDSAYEKLSKNSKLRNYLTKEGRKQRSDIKKEIRRETKIGYDLEAKMLKNHNNDRKAYKLAKKKLKDERKNATTGLRY